VGGSGYHPGAAALVILIVDRLCDDSRRLAGGIGLARSRSNQITSPPSLFNETKEDGSEKPLANAQPLAPAMLDCQFCQS
jgi:hypothetical protein